MVAVLSQFSDADDKHHKYNVYLNRSYRLFFVHVSTWYAQIVTCHFLLTNFVEYIVLKIHRPISTLQAGDINNISPPLTFVDLNFLRFLF
jgi:hypothetical protein